MLRPLILSLTTLGLLGLAAARQEAPPELPRFVTLSVPDSLPDPDHPGLAAPTAGERLDLGRRLFFDTALSKDRTVSCGTCHRPEHGFADDQPLSKGIGGAKTKVNVPTLLNRYLGSAFMWDGRFETLEDQVLDPIANPDEMGLPVEEALERLKADPSYARAFATAWPEEGLSRRSLAGSLAHFIRHIRIGDSPVDAFRFGDGKALTAQEKRGLWLYESRAQCWRCHRGPDFTDEIAHNTGIGAVDGEPRPGRFAHTGEEKDRGRFKTPTLRGLVHTAPYMHDGSLATLKDVVEFYRKGGNPNSNLDREIVPLTLTDADVAALVAFLEALSR